MKKLFIYILIFLVSAFELKSQTYPDEYDFENDRLRAVLIFQISKYVTWPNEDKIDTFTLGVYTKYSSIYKEIVKAAQEFQTIKDKPVKVVKFTKFKKIYPTDILYVANDKINDVYKINPIINDKPTLLITDRFTDYENIMVNLLSFKNQSGEERRFEINQNNLKAHNLTASNELIFYGGRLGDLQQLYNTLKKDLEKQREELDKKIQENQKLQENIKLQQIEIEQQQKRIAEQKFELEKVSKKIDEKEKELKENLETLQKQNALIKRKQQELQLKKRELALKTKELEKKTKEIKEKQKELKKLEKKIQEAQSNLSKANEQIQTQKGVITIGLAFITLILIFSLIIFRAYRINRRINRELKQKNEEILKQKRQIELQANLLEATNKELEKLSIVAENAQNGIAIMDKYGNIEWVNAGFTKMYGYTLQLLINERDRNIAKASENPKIQEYLNECIEKKINVTYETENTKRNGEKIWVKTTLTPILDDDGEIIRLVAIDTDITEIKKAEQEIRKQHDKIKAQAEALQKANEELKKLSIVAEAIDNAVIITDATGTYEWVNPAFVRIFGFTFEDLMRTKPNLIKFTTKPQVKAAIEKALKTKKSVNYQFQTRNKQGKTIWVQATITPLLNDNGEIEKLIFVDSDITALKQAEQQIIEKNHELLAQKEKIEFQNRQIQASIKYAQTIQQTILPPVELVEKYFEHQLIYLPKDIVSGDFYWFIHIPEEKTCFVAAVDCTGHGVPGAFMSLIASRILNEVVQEKKLRDPAEILEDTDNLIRKALRQETSNNRDGLDIVLCKISRDINNENAYNVEYAGAKRPLIYFSYKTKKIETIEATRRSIGGVSLKHKREFKTHKLTLYSNDVLYLMTDGLIDQNDPQRKQRYGSKRLFQLLNEIKNYNIAEQKNRIYNAFLEFKKDSPQRDDITVWILKLK